MAQDPRIEIEEEPSMQAEPNLEGAVVVDHRGERYALGRTSDSYAVWALSGGPAVRTFPQEDQHWPEAWETFQDLESGRGAEVPAATGAEQPAPSAAQTGASPPEGLVVMDYRGSSVAVGRTRNAYAIWDNSRGGTPLETHPITEDGWQIAWHRYQQLEAGGRGAPPEEGASRVAPSLAATPSDTAPESAEGSTAPAPTEEPTSEAEPTPAAKPGPGLERAAAIDYRGRAYALGRTADGYAIWDVNTGGEPILTFPATTEAWNQAWGAYQRLEGAGGG
jgi:hypothetical protein